MTKLTHIGGQLKPLMMHQVGQYHGDELLVMMQHGEHIEGCEINEDVMHGELHVEGKLVTHVKPVWRSMGSRIWPTIDGERIDAHETNKVVVLSYNSSF